MSRDIVEDKVVSAKFSEQYDSPLFPGRIDATPCVISARFCKLKSNHPYSPPWRENYYRDEKNTFFVYFGVHSECRLAAG